MREQMAGGKTAGAPRKQHKTSVTTASRNLREVPLTPELIDGYLEHLRAKGRASGTIDSYRRKLKRLYQELPEEDKVIRRETLPRWREELAADGCSAVAINQFMIAANGYLEYMDAREFQVVDKLKVSNGPQPELTRNEYLRLLSAARLLGRRQVYLMVKVFGNSDLPVQELEHLTVEAAQKGMLSVRYNYSTEIIRFPGGICRELLDYAEREGIRSGPIFLTRGGKPIDRRNVTMAIRRLCATAQVSEEKGNPRCLRKLYQTVRADLERNIALLVEQAQDRMLEDEHQTVGWDQ